MSFLGGGIWGGVVRHDANRHGELEKVFAVAAVAVEEVSYAVSELVEFESVKSASGMKRAVVTFLDEVSKLERMVESDVVLRDT